MRVGAVPSSGFFSLPLAHLSGVGQHRCGSAAAGCIGPLRSRRVLPILPRSSIIIPLIGLQRPTRSMSCLESLGSPIVGQISSVPLCADGPSCSSRVKPVLVQNSELSP